VLLLVNQNKTRDTLNGHNQKYDADIVRLTNARIIIIIIIMQLLCAKQLQYQIHNLYQYHCW